MPRAHCEYSPSASAVPTLSDIESRMSELDTALYAKAARQYQNREIHPEWECYQLDGSTFIRRQAFEPIVGDERDHYMAWKNGCIDESSLPYWDEPAVMSYLVDRSINEGDGDECCWSDAQPINYAQSCTVAPSTVLQRCELGWRVTGTADDGLTYALFGHPNVDVIENESGILAVVSTCHPERIVTADYRGDAWHMRMFLRDGTAPDRPCSEALVFDWRDVPRIGGYDEIRRRFRAAKMAFDYAIYWVDSNAW